MATLKLLPEVKAKWLSALRSGNFRQGVHKLRSIPPESDPDQREAFCCLGVLCELAARERVGHWEQATTTCYKMVGSDGYSQTSYLPRAVHLWATGTTNDLGPDPQTVPRPVLPQGDLTGFNDSADWTFPQIADWIEANL